MSGADYDLQPDLLDNGASSAAAEQRTAAVEVASANSASETPTATKQSSLRKKLSWLFSVLSLIKAAVRQSTQGTTDQPQASCSPPVAASSDALILSALVQPYISSFN